jgi:ribose transport system ATP-binding protein
LALICRRQSKLPVSDGLLVLYVSHRPEEVFAIADRITVLRDGRKVETACGSLLEQLRVVRRSLDQPMGQLSGGNRQKMLMARSLLCAPKLFICDEPIRGVDVGAKEEIHRILADVASRGVGITIISSEFKELVSLCHRVLAVRGGHIAAQFTSPEFNETRILAAAAGIREYRDRDLAR